MPLGSRRLTSLASAITVALAGYCAAGVAYGASSVSTVPGMPPVANAANLYSEAAAGQMSPAVNGAVSRIYIPNLRSNDVYVVDPGTFKVIDKFNVGIARSTSYRHGTCKHCGSPTMPKAARMAA